MPKDYEANDEERKRGLKISNSVMAQIIMDLQGTTKSLNEAVRDNTCHSYTEESLAPEQTDMIDAAIFLCDSCGWWCEMDELNNDTGDEYCNDCAEDALEP